MVRSEGERRADVGVAILIGEERYPATKTDPFVFGRLDGPGIVGLDASDMGLSAEAGAVEFAWGLWWVVNRSRKRPLFIEAPKAAAPYRLECGDRYAVTASRLAVLVPGAIYTHRIEIHIPEETIAALHVADAPTSGTLTFDRVRLSSKDKTVLATVFAGYLRSFPRHDPHPASYQKAAEALGPPWTRVTVRKQVERIKERFARHEIFFEGPRANEALAEHLIDNALLTPMDLAQAETEHREGR